MERIIREYDPDFIHVAVEGPLGVSARNACRRLNLKFTTAYHTQFPEYLEKKYGVPAKLTAGYMRWFHGASSKIFVATQSISDDLLSAGIVEDPGKIHRWSRGVDMEMFSPNSSSQELFSGPYAVYVGRVSIEKNIEDFLRLDLPGISKVVVGDGPDRERLQAKFSGAGTFFAGALKGEALAGAYSNASFFVFPSKTDTFGLVVVEALASGIPVVAYNVQGPKDIFSGLSKGAVILKKLGGLADSFDELELLSQHFARVQKDSEACRKFVAENFTWETATSQFVGGLIPVK
jgi:glycosyltransferase involved in cell wall biosynthesis